jgi:hypothetical protein
MAATTSGRSTDPPMMVNVPRQLITGSTPIDINILAVCDRIRNDFYQYQDDVCGINFRERYTVRFLMMSLRFIIVVINCRLDESKYKIIPRTRKQSQRLLPEFFIFI